VGLLSPSSLKQKQQLRGPLVGRIQIKYFNRRKKKQKKKKLKEKSRVEDPVKLKRQKAEQGRDAEEDKTSPQRNHPTHKNPTKNTNAESKTAHFIRESRRASFHSAQKTFTANEVWESYT